MALQQIFTDIANAIRSKKGYNTKEEYPIYPYDMANEINNIEQGGGQVITATVIELPIISGVLPQISATVTEA